MESAFGVEHGEIAKYRATTPEASRRLKRTKQRVNSSNGTLTPAQAQGPVTPNSGPYQGKTITAH